MERTSTLVPIGRFSRLCGLTVKALRHYDEIGLLKPARVDGSTGYRYYSPSNYARPTQLRGSERSTCRWKSA